MYLADQILKPENILKAKPIAEAVFSNVKTDLTLGEIVWMANQAMQVDTSNIQMFTLPGYAASSYAGTDAFLSFFFPDESETLELINTYFNPYDKQITSLDVIESPPDGVRRTGSTDEDEDTYDYDYSGQEEASDEEESYSDPEPDDSEEDPESTDSGEDSDGSSGSYEEEQNTPVSDDGAQGSDGQADSDSEDAPAEEAPEPEPEPEAPASEPAGDAPISGDPEA